MDCLIIWRVYLLTWLVFAKIRYNLFGKVAAQCNLLRLKGGRVFHHAILCYMGYNHPQINAKKTTISVKTVHRPIARWFIG